MEWLDGATRVVVPAEKRSLRLLSAIDNASLDEFTRPRLLDLAASSGLEMAAEIAYAVHVADLPAWVDTAFGPG